METNSISPSSTHRRLFPALALLVILFLLAPLEAHASTPAKMQLAGIEQLGVKLRIVDLRTVKEGELHSLSAPIQKHVEDLLFEFGIAKSDDSDVIFRILIEVSGIKGSEDVAVLIIASLQEPVVVVRSPGTEVPGGAQTWWSNRFQVAPKSELRKSLQDFSLVVAEEFARDALVARNIQSRCK